MKMGYGIDGVTHTPLWKIITVIVSINVTDLIWSNVNIVVLIVMVMMILSVVVVVGVVVVIWTILESRHVPVDDSSQSPYSVPERQWWWLFVWMFYGIQPYLYSTSTLSCILRIPVVAVADDDDGETAPNRYLSSYPVSVASASFLDVAEP